jgi:putative ABC transport system permease protein
VRTSTMEDLVSRSGAQRRFVMLIFAVFAAVALVLAATGIYGLLAGAVNERTREIGIRSALGASRGDILGLVLRQGLTLTGVGLAIGLAGAAIASRTLVTLLFGISRLDPQTYAGVLVAIGAVAAIACWVPAGRAARVDPAITLRSE